MRDIISDVDRWVRSGDEPIAIATVLKTYGSAPRGVGGKLAIGGDGKITGSISGGCVESTIVDEGMKMSVDAGPKILHFETSDENAWEVGLPCGGTIDVLLELLDRDHFEFLKRKIESNEWAYSITVIDAEAGTPGRKVSFDQNRTTIGSIDPSNKALETRLMDSAFRAERSMRTRTADGMELFVEVFPPAPTLVLVGGVHIAIALVKFAKVLGYRTIVVDPRRTFGNPERFPDVDRLIQEWPDAAFKGIEITPETSVVLLTHDPKLDDPALYHALKSPASYIGALGSNRTQERRKRRLLDMGFTEGELSRIHGPIGLDIDAATPEEIALSITAEMVALSHHATSVLRASDFALDAPRTEPSIPS